MTAKAKHEGPLRVPFKFDDAVKRALAVKPPEDGWKAYEKKLKAEKRKRRSKPAA